MEANETSGACNEVFCHELLALAGLTGKIDCDMGLTAQWIAENQLSGN